MSSAAPLSEQSFPADASSATAESLRTAPRPQRILACVLCQQRKLRCDHRVPSCSNCAKTGAQCVPAKPAARQRRRRFPERELLERLRNYEGLLRQNDINFEPLHGDQASSREEGRGGTAPNDSHAKDADENAGQTPSEESATKSESVVYGPKSVWRAMTQRSQDSDDDAGADDDPFNDRDRGVPLLNFHETSIRKAWEESCDGNDHLLFESRKSDADLSTLHPEHVQIFRLWQIYLDNVNPLLKVTHTPTLQTQLIDAAGDVSHISPTLAPLLFAIYSMAILSLEEGECHTLLGASRQDLLNRYQFGCKQALVQCRYLRTSDRNCLTALYLYLVSIRPQVDPRSLSSLLGVALRIARRLGIHDESRNTKCTVLEAEMRRRLWWSLVTFDNRIAELSDYKTAESLTPLWNCRLPTNVNDFDIRPEMREPPASQDQPTEALFAVVRSALGDFVRHSAFHLDFTNPSLKAIARDARRGSYPEGDELLSLQKTLEDKYLSLCNPENPLHFVTIWMTRCYLAKSFLLEHCARHTGPSSPPTDGQREAAIKHALDMLECDTKLVTSPLTKGYGWLVYLYFPMPAYHFIVPDLRRRPLQEDSERIWRIMGDHFRARFSSFEHSGPFFLHFAHPILQAWKARQAASGARGTPPKPPQIITEIEREMAATLAAKDPTAEQSGSTAGSLNTDDFLMPMSMDFGGLDLPHNGKEQDFAGFGPLGYFDPTGQPAMDIDMNQLNLTATDWNQMRVQGW